MNIFGYFTLREKAFKLPSFECFHLAISRFGEIVVITLDIGKTLNSIDLVNLMSSISVRFNSFLFSYSIFNERKRPYPFGFDLLLPSEFEASAYRCTSPIIGSRHCRVVGLDGLEPSTSRLSGVRSNHLSYKPISFTQLVVRFFHHTLGPDTVGWWR